MNGSRFLILVLLLVLAIPLIAAHDLVNPVVELSAISIDLEEVSFSDQELFDNNVPVLSVGLNEEHPNTYIVSVMNGESTYYNKNGTGQTYTNKNTIHGGIKRTNLRKH